MLIFFFISYSLDPGQGWRSALGPKGLQKLAAKWLLARKKLSKLDWYVYKGMVIHHNHYLHNFTESNCNT